MTHLRLANAHALSSPRHGFLGRPLTHLFQNALRMHTTGERRYTRRPPQDRPVSRSGKKFPKQFPPRDLRSRTPDRKQADTHPAVLTLQNATSARDAELALRAYRALSSQEKKHLTFRESRIITSCLLRFFNAVRPSRPDAPFPDLQSLTSLAAQITADIKHGALQVTGPTYVDLLSFYTSSGQLAPGRDLWQWLQAHPDDPATIECYGAAIELLAHSNVPLPEIEALYQLALSKFPGTFAAYHVSPHAILPSRTHRLSIPDISPSLLHGITVARLRHGATAPAYLALDAALRLWPDALPARFVLSFLDARPIDEAYQVFAQTRLGASILPMYVFRRLLRALRLSGISEPRLADQARGVRAMLSATLLWVAGGGGPVSPISPASPPFAPISSTILTELTIGITRLARVRGFSLLPADERSAIISSLFTLTQSLPAIFAGHSSGAKLKLTAYHAIINNLGASNRLIIAQALSAIAALNLVPNNVTWRILVTTAARLRDKDLFRSAWQNLLVLRAPNHADFAALVGTAASLDMPDFARAQLEHCKDVLDPVERVELEHRLAEPARAAGADGAEDAADSPLDAADSPLDAAVPPLDATDPPLDPAALREEIARLQSDLSVLDTLLRAHPAPPGLPPPAWDLTHLHPRLPLTTQRPIPPLPPRDLRALYDALTTAPGAPPPPAPAPDHAPTQLPLDSLRFSHWSAITQLLARARENDAAHVNAVTDAMARGKVPWKMAERWGRGNRDDGSWGISGEGLGEGMGVLEGEGEGVGVADEEGGELDPDELQRRIAEVRRLRGYEA